MFELFLHLNITVYTYIGIAQRLIVDAVAVVLEGFVVGVDGHRDRAVGGDGRSKSILNDSKLINH